MKAIRFVVLAGLMFFGVFIMMQAQGGCVDSLEAPTDVLMLVGFVGMIYGSSMVIKMLRKSRKQ